MTPSQGQPAPDEQVHDPFAAIRPRLFGLAYRMTGSAMDAEDLLQEAWLRWRSARTEVRQPEAWLVRTTTNLCLDHLRSAQVRRERYIGSWLPEPLVSDERPLDGALTRRDTANPRGLEDSHAEGPEQARLLAESLTPAFLLLLERLSPLERAAWLLRRAFDYPYDELATLLERSPGACRQLVSRASRHLAGDRPRFEVPDSKQHVLAATFLAAARDGDLDALEAMLAEDAIVISDGGGKVAAALRPIEGPARVARFFAGLAAKAPTGMTVSSARVNGQPGFVMRLPEAALPVLVLSFHIDRGRIHAVHAMRNPEKLRRLSSRT